MAKNNPLQEVVNKMKDTGGDPNRKNAKSILAVIAVVLLGALGLEITNNDFDLGTLLSTGSPEKSRVERDAGGNLQRSDTGQVVTAILRDLQGNQVPEGTAGAKYTNQYNCEDFKTQSEAQIFYDNAGGLQGDTNRLDGDKDGIACESLPKGN